eukprot:GHVT01015916.1.p1 GENE.GHVT01015916.1~~GHVT01015916.1.p1  ORF type:complete len:149 (-),score=22.62 GHVT01015916.1:417-863(-)
MLRLLLLVGLFFFSGEYFFNCFRCSFSPLPIGARVYSALPPPGLGELVKPRLVFSTSWATLKTIYSLKYFLAITRLSCDVRSRLCPTAAADFASTCGAPAVRTVAPSFPGAPLRRSCHRVARGGTQPRNLEEAFGFRDLVIQSLFFGF